jgi:hypothetical protein
MVAFLLFLLLGGILYKPEQGSFLKSAKFKFYAFKQQRHRLNIPIQNTSHAEKPHAHIQ